MDERWLLSVTEGLRTPMIETEVSILIDTPTPRVGYGRHHQP